MHKTFSSAHRNLTSCLLQGLRREEEREPIRLFTLLTAKSVSRGNGAGISPDGWTYCMRIAHSAYSKWQSQQESKSLCREYSATYMIEDAKIERQSRFISVSSVENVQNRDLTNSLWSTKSCSVKQGH